MIHAAKHGLTPDYGSLGLEVPGLEESWYYFEAVESEVVFRAANDEERISDSAPPRLKMAVWEASRDRSVVEGAVIRVVRLLESY